MMEPEWQDYKEPWGGKPEGVRANCEVERERYLGKPIRQKAREAYWPNTRRFRICKAPAQQQASAGEVPSIPIGMTLRDWFAGQALAGFLAGTAFPTLPESVRAKAAYSMADSMLRARVTAKGGE